jgi:hypothetical protein
MPPEWDRVGTGSLQIRLLKHEQISLAAHREHERVNSAADWAARTLTAGQVVQQYGLAHARLTAHHQRPAGSGRC